MTLKENSGVDESGTASTWMNVVKTKAEAGKLLRVKLA
jgi:hypothetical protein